MILDQKKIKKDYDIYSSGIATCEASIERLNGVVKGNSKSLKLSESELNIALLDLENHEIKLEAKAEIGIGLNHARWQAANAA